MGIAACQPGGRIVLVGMGQEDMTLPMTAATTSEIDIFGSFRYVNTVRCKGSDMRAARVYRGTVRQHSQFTRFMAITRLSALQAMREISKRSCGRDKRVCKRGSDTNNEPAPFVPVNFTRIFIQIACKGLGHSSADFIHALHALAVRISVTMTPAQHMMYYWGRHIAAI